MPLRSDEENVAHVLDRIDQDELAALALDLGNIDSPPGCEKPVADFLIEWLFSEGISAKAIALNPDRPNVVGNVVGSGGGHSLLFNAHMDTSVSDRDIWIHRDPQKEIDHRAWRDEDHLYGNGIVNDKGPMACFLIAAKALREAGIILKGDLILTAVVGEIEWEPIDEYLPDDFASHDLGCRYMVSRGVVADYALVAENTQLAFGPLEAGKCLFKITVYGEPSLYVPYLCRPYRVSENPNAIVRMCKLVEKLEEWALKYENASTYESEWGRLTPKVNIGAIRGGAPYFPSVSPEICTIYVDVRTPPAQDPLAVKHSLEQLVRSLDFKGEVELYVHRRGYEAKGIEPLAESVERAHRRVVRQDMKRVSGPRASMWRDTNVFNEAGIPAANYGPGAGRGHGGIPAVSMNDLVQAAKVYALTAMDICNQEKHETKFG